MAEQSVRDICSVGNPTEPESEGYRVAGSNPVASINWREKEKYQRRRAVVARRIVRKDISVAAPYPHSCGSKVDGYLNSDVAGSIPADAVNVREKEIQKVGRGRWVINLPDGSEPCPCKLDKVRSRP